MSRLFGRALLPRSSSVAAVRAVRARPHPDPVQRRRRSPARRHLARPFGIALDARGKIYAANISQNATPSITVYAANPSGTLNVAPLAKIAGSNTGLSGPTSVAVDAGGLIYVGNSGGSSINVYAANPNGTLNEAPVATITGSNTGENTAGGPAFVQPVIGIAVH
jgi:hypothetical protein